jgi:hypothetical protein
MSELKFKIGADPEFNLELEGKKLDAAATLKTILGSNKEFKFIEKGGNNVGGYKYKTLGETGEIRPSAEKTPKDLVENMKQIFTKFYEIAPSFQITTLSRYAPIGGHIHFELNDKITEDRDTQMAKVQAIHKRMASFMLPITLGENKVNLMVRLRSDKKFGQYCTADAFRVEHQYTKANGEPGYTYELRVPSAEWLTTPKIARATIAYLTTIYNEITNHTKKFNEENKDIIIRTNEMGNALQSLALTEYKIITKAVFSTIKRRIKTFELYETYKEEIDYILDPNKVLNDKIAVDYDVRLGWELQKKEKEASKKNILSEKEFKKISNEKDIESLSKIYTIDYNNDLNVKTFIDILQQKMAAFNWRLKKQFFFFGIRKGIDEYIVMDNNQKIIKGLEIAKTTSDKKTIEKIMTNMYQKYIEEYTQDTKTKLNFTTGKIEKIAKEVVIIGIPYKDRINLNTKKFTEIVYDVDKGSIKEINSKNELINDDDKKEEEKGEIYKIVNKTNKEDKNKELAIEANSDDESMTDEKINQIEKEIDETIDIITQDELKVAKTKKEASFDEDSE